MSKKEPVFNFDNVLILLNLFMAGSASFFLPYFAVSLASLATIILYDEIAVLGTVFLLIGAVTIYMGEFHVPSAKAMADEMRADPVMQQIRSEPGSQKLFKLFDRFLAFGEANHKYILRTTEFILVAAGLTLVAIHEHQKMMQAVH